MDARVPTSSGVLSTVEKDVPNRPSRTPIQVPNPTNSDLLVVDRNGTLSLIVTPFLFLALSGSDLEVRDRSSEAAL